MVMELMIITWLVVLVLSIIGVSSNPAPFYGALALVIAAGSGGVLLAVFGAPFLSLVFFLIYLGGMLVVFGYATALAADSDPETLADDTAFEFVVFFVGLAAVGVMWFWGSWYEFGVGVLTSFKEFFVSRGDADGTGMLYFVGGFALGVSVVGLILALVVVLELSRGSKRGCLRAP
uniref:NADH-ubiquinone oxidoreductase chain 6 n=1 Tax=Etrumeus micropus TaxID=942859 RepID=A5PIH1_9TELE|nr:NADH dehydrogenase subunit 6 [Etrumeus teres]BAF64060.1 NADH dehydrogenase subunit 6 [Etrumeus micropus]